MIVIDNFPPYANTDQVILSIADRAQGHSWHARQEPKLGLGHLPDPPARFTGRPVLQARAGVVPA